MITRPLVFTKRFPKSPRKPYSPLTGVKAMTIGIGFDCLGGLIMGADRQMTLPGSHKYADTKLFYDIKDDRILALIGGNDLSLAKELWWKLVERPILDYDSCERALTDILNEMGRFYADLPLQLLCGIATKTNVHLLEFRGKGVCPILDDLGIICVGDSSLIRYLSKNIELFFQFEKDGIAIATYLLKRAEQFIDGCSGPMDIIILRPGPQIHVINPQMIEDLDKRLVENQSKVFKELFSLSPPFSIVR